MVTTLVADAREECNCQLAWLLALRRDHLATVGVDTMQGHIQTQIFQDALHTFCEAGTFPYADQDNPIAQVLLRRSPLINLATSTLDHAPGGIPLATALNTIDVHYISLLPLVVDEEPIGVLVLGAEGKSVMGTSSTHDQLDVIQHEAAYRVENWLLRSERTEPITSDTATGELQRFLLDNVAGGAVLVDRQRLIRQVNQRLLAMTGWYADNLIDQDVHVLFTVTSKPAALQALNEFDSRTSLQTLDTSAGDGLPVNMAVTILPNADSQIEFSLLTFQPTTTESDSLSDGTIDIEAQRLGALTRAAQALNSALSLTEVIDIILTSALDVVNGVAASLLLIDIDNPEELIHAASAGPYGEAMQGRRVPVGIGVVGWVAAEAKAQLVPNISHDPRFESGLDAHEELIVRSLAAIPLKSSDTVIGVLEVVNKENGLFDESDLEILESLGSSAAVAVQNANLYDQTRRRLTELSTLLEASAAVTSTLELHDILDHITRRLLNALDVHRVVVATSEDQGETLGILAERVDSTWTLYNALKIKLSDTLHKQLALERRLVTIASTDQSDLTFDERQELSVRNMRTVFNVPLTLDDAVVGVVALYHKRTDMPFDTVEQTTVGDLIRDWSHEDDPWQSVTPLCHRLIGKTTSNWVAIYRWNSEEGYIALIREVGSSFAVDGDADVWGLHEYPLMQHVVASGDPRLVWTQEFESDVNEKTYLTQVGAGTALMVPLIIRGQSAGLIKAMAVERRLFDSGELSLCQGIANTVGNALENAALYLSLEQRAKAVEAAYRDLEAADELKDNLLQNLSHEISTPLMHILGYVSLMRDGAFGELTPEQEETLDQVVKKSDHIAEIVRDMVAAYATRSGQLNLKRVKLQNIAALTIRSLSGKANAAGIRIVSDFEDNLPRVYVDPALIGQVFEALLDNAIKFSHSGQEIEVTLRDQDGPMMQACVRDYGIGIAPEEQDKIFMRFYQVHSGTTRRFEGTGLGLSIVYDVIDSHGGNVWLESGISQGTAVYFTIPKANLARNGASEVDFTL